LCANSVKLLSLHGRALITYAVLDPEQTLVRRTRAGYLSRTTMGNGEYPLGNGHVSDSQEI